jgi:DeoR/GlpR family transcriptional regulator of sugar metabolism
MNEPEGASPIPAFDPQHLPLRSYLPPQRRQAILDLVVQRGQVDVGFLSDLFGVSKVTVRGDLDQLAKQNLITRSRGGAGSALHQSLALTFSVRALQNREQKRRIARAALSLLVPGETVILDAGTTVVELSSCMSNAAELTIVTPALNIATQLGSLPGVELVTVGGRLDPNTISNVGPIAEMQMRGVLAHKVFLGVHVIDQQGDLAEPIEEHAGLKRAMVHAARQVILLADSTKWGARPAKAKVVPLSACHTVVTDTGLDGRYLKAMEAEGIKVIVT